MDNLRNQFVDSERKNNLVSILRKRLQLCNDLAGRLAHELKRLGVSEINGKINDDKRFLELTNTILKLEYFLEPLRNLVPVAKSLLAIPSNDLLFEYFSYATIVEAIHSLGFVTSDIGEGSPVPFY